jgi:CheY-like chemotaxis protein
MNGVIGMTGLLLDTRLSPQQREYVETVRKSGEGLLRIINDILDFSKIEAGKLAIESLPFDLRLLIEEVCELLIPKAEKRSLDLAVDYPPGIPRRFAGDGDRIRQVLTNLVGNAIKFTDSGGIAIAVEYLERDENQATLRVAVRDSGVGIPEEKIHTLFEKFCQVDGSTTRKYGGTGLGLAISKQLVELMGGAIGVESRLGKGSTFWFTVPLALDAEPYAAPSPVYPLRGQPERRKFAPCPADTGIRALVAEDNVVNQRVARLMLERLGVRVDMAGNGIEAVEMFRLAPYDLIFMDCQMPEMDGYEATGEIRSREGQRALPRTPIVAMTANAMAGDRELCLRAGMDDYVSKPLTVAELERVLSHWGLIAEAGNMPLCAGVEAQRRERVSDSGG